MSYIYTYLTSKEDFEKEIPFTDKEAYDEHVEKYPSVYPCILEFEDQCSEFGFQFHIEIIEDMSNFIYQNGNLYKLDTKSSFIYENGSLYKKC